MSTHSIRSEMSRVKLELGILSAIISLQDLFNRKIGNVNKTLGRLFFFQNIIIADFYGQ